ncbi:hypothetical protein BGZ57DRAFT_775028, partial [Hyaloscypha finlandica]
SAIYINIAQILVVSNIDKWVENGQNLDTKVKLLSGVLSHHTPFKAANEPRSPPHEATILSIEKIQHWAGE